MLGIVVAAMEIEFCKDIKKILMFYHFCMTRSEIKTPIDIRGILTSPIEIETMK